ncbi:hypothetical protein FRX31_016184 [Thalictrum thalictroides]|uniref:ARID domain-containing protein n=1 Tax=Thalictrum thalictroides TaxID=46969 RepID=A0A7J6W9Z9_THATH|nr:hypothetical protein FRX31_016184 [Thalictrum thalictroides]
MDTLLDLHKSLATKFVVPIMGGKALDLHRLFVEVTARGGLEKNSIYNRLIRSNGIDSVKGLPDGTPPPSNLDATQNVPRP